MTLFQQPKIDSSAPKENIDLTQIQKGRLSEFSEEVKKFIPKENIPVTQEQLLGIIQTAYSKLADTQAPQQGAITLSKLNAELSKHGFAIAIAANSEGKLEDLTVIKFDPKKETAFDGNRFKALIGLTNYPNIGIAEGERVNLLNNNQNSVTPGQTFIRENQKALVFTYPEEIKKQVDIFKSKGVNIDISSMTDMVRINEASHALLDVLLQGKEVNIDGLRIPIKGEIAVRVGALDTKQFHELWSDAATFKLTKDLPGAVSMLGRQSDQDHAATFQLLNSSMFVALHLWTTEAVNPDDQKARASFASSVVKPQGNGQVSIDFDKISAKMKSDPILRGKISEVVGGVYEAIASGVLIETLKPDPGKK